MSEEPFIQHFRVVLEEATDIPRAIRDADWRDLFTYQSLRMKRNFLFHSLTITEILFLTVLGIYIELSPEKRSLAHIDHRIAVAQFNLILEAIASQPVRDCLVEVMSDWGILQLREELRTIGWDGR